MDQNNEGVDSSCDQLLKCLSYLVAFFETTEREKLKIITEELIDEVEGGDLF